MLTLFSVTPRSIIYLACLGHITVLLLEFCVLIFCFLVYAFCVCIQHICIYIRIFIYKICFLHALSI